MKRQELRQIIKEELELLKSSKEVKPLKEGYRDFDPSEYRWDFQIHFLQEMEKEFKAEDPNVLLFPHTCYVVPSEDYEQVAKASLWTDGNSSYVVITDFDNEDVVYQRYNDWKKAFKVYKNILGISRIAAIANGRKIFMK
jgi:hypothetical protein